MLIILSFRLRFLLWILATRFFFVIYLLNYSISSVTLDKDTDYLQTEFNLDPQKKITYLERKQSKEKVQKSTHSIQFILT